MRCESSFVHNHILYLGKSYSIFIIFVARKKN